jgi:hypothetical protein
MNVTSASGGSPDGLQLVALCSRADNTHPASISSVPTSPVGITCALSKTSIPETLERVGAKRIAYVHIDMNCAPPEVAAAHFFLDRLVPGAFMLLDDYAYYGYSQQKVAIDVFAVEKGVDICSLPTGQGLLIKPPR